MPKLRFVYDQEGGVEIDGVGFKGNTCEKATADFVRGRKQLANKKKPEYYQNATTGVKSIA